MLFKVETAEGPKFFTSGQIAAALGLTEAELAARFKEQETPT